MFKIRHMTCGGTALWYEIKPMYGEIIHAKFALQKNFKPQDGQKVKCDNCGKCVNTSELDYL